METQVEDIPVTIPPVEIDLEALPDQEAKQDILVEVNQRLSQELEAKQ